MKTEPKAAVFVLQKEPAQMRPVVVLAAGPESVLPELAGLPDLYRTAEKASGFEFDQGSAEELQKLTVETQ